MNKTAIAFSTKDRIELSKQSIEPLLQPDKFDLFWVDGSKTEEGETFVVYKMACSSVANHVRLNVRGGADAAIAYSLTEMLNHPNNYDYVGLVENDVLLDPNWFDKTMELFDAGKAEGLEVGAVSARAYEDRILVQRDGYAVMLNLGAGQAIFSRRAARLVLENFRTGITSELRKTFMQVSGLDIARWSGFARDPHICCADWTFDRLLAQHGLVSLALTPAKCQMIGQVPSLEEQGLTLATGPVEERRDDKAFDTLVERTSLIRSGDFVLPNSRFLQNDDGSYTIFPHQIEMLGGGYEGDWKLKWCQGHGPFAWEASEVEDITSINLYDHLREPGVKLGRFATAKMTVPISGPCALIVSGGKSGGRITIADEMTGWEMTMEIQTEGEQGQVASLAIPGNIGYRNIRLTALTPGITFYGVSTREPQSFLPHVKFDHSELPQP